MSLLTPACVLLLRVLFDGVPLFKGSKMTVLCRTSKWVVYPADQRHCAQIKLNVAAPSSRMAQIYFLGKETKLWFTLFSLWNQAPCPLGLTTFATHNCAVTGLCNHLISSWSEGFFVLMKLNHIYMQLKYLNTVVQVRALSSLDTYNYFVAYFPLEPKHHWHFAISLKYFVLKKLERDTSES